VALRRVNTNPVRACLTVLVLGALLSSFLEEALYKCSIWMNEWIIQCTEVHRISVYRYTWRIIPWMPGCSSWSNKSFSTESAFFIVWLERGPWFTTTIFYYFSVTNRLRTAIDQFLVRNSFWHHLAPGCFSSLRILINSSSLLKAISFLSFIRMMTISSKWGMPFAKNFVFCTCWQVQIFLSNFQCA